MKMRLDRALRDGQAGRTRSEAEKLIASGRVSVNGQTVRRPEYKVDSETDRIELDGQAVSSRRFRYYMLNKPAGVLSATEDRRERTVLDLLPPELQRLGLSPAGRLDKDAEGLLLLTNDGACIHDVITPKRRVEKQYFVRLRDPAGADYAEAFRAGITIDGGYTCLPGRFLPGEHPCEGRVCICEGKFHQVKRMLAALGNEVLYLRRLSVGGLRLDETLGPGAWKELDEADIRAIFEQKTAGNS